MDRWHRSRDDRMLAGVAAGLGRSLDLTPVAVRLAFCVLALAGGVGVLAYGLAWALVPEADDPGPAPERSDPQRLVGLVCVVVGVLVLVAQLDPGLVDDRVLWPLLVIMAGLALVAWQASRSGEGSDLLIDTRYGLVRAVAGVMLAAAGVAALFLANVSVSALRDGLVAVVLIVGGVGLVIGPYLFLLARDLAEERRARVRADERARVAAHLHDSVLQTLSMIQRDPTRAVSLARRQERELRAWLHDRVGDPGVMSLAAAVEALATEIEDLYELPVEVVVVGSRDVDVRHAALFAAAREAMNNAAKHSGADRVSVYAEASGDELEVYVRDTGCGFDPVDVTWRGLAHSIVERMERAGGRAEVRAEPGHGTEVHLTLPVDPPPDAGPVGTGHEDEDARARS
jgi:signal transduction histidine kinase/phage shock protein PspC (stress-responsive transcriptional regulator)